MITILGLGFTGIRVARQLIAQGIPVAAAVREPERYSGLAATGTRIVSFDETGKLPRGAPLFYSIPPQDRPAESALRALVKELRPPRVVYVSSTGVYGEQRFVDASTLPVPADERGRARLDAEEWFRFGDWDTLALRAAAIYGPGRGVHCAVREGRMPRGGGSAVVSRIHVADLATLAAAGLESDLVGAWPVADETPCASAEIAEWCVKNYGWQAEPLPSREFAVAGRSVDGREICRLLNIRLAYPGWEAGIIASLTEEREPKRD